MRLPIQASAIQRSGVFSKSQVMAAVLPQDSCSCKWDKKLEKCVTKKNNCVGSNKPKCSGDSSSCSCSCG
jgi:hypothetical protein